MLRNLWTKFKGLSLNYDTIPKSINWIPKKSQIKLTRQYLPTKTCYFP